MDDSCLGILLSVCVCLLISLSLSVAAGAAGAVEAAGAAEMAGTGLFSNLYLLCIRVGGQYVCFLFGERGLRVLFKSQR